MCFIPSDPEFVSRILLPAVELSDWLPNISSAGDPRVSPLVGAFLHPSCSVGHWSDNERQSLVILTALKPSSSQGGLAKQAGGRSGGGEC